MALSREAKARAFGAVLKDLEHQLAAMNVDRAKERKRKKAAPEPEVEEQAPETEED